MVLFQKEVASPKVLWAAHRRVQPAFLKKSKVSQCTKKVEVFLFPIPGYCPALSSLVAHAQRAGPGVASKHLEHDKDLIITHLFNFCKALSETRP